MAYQKTLPLVTIITPTLNSERFIVDNIQSIRTQTYPHIEHVVIDGASTDSTLSLVAKHNPSATLVSEKDRGISDAFNKGLALAKGEIIAILNSDDYYLDSNTVQKVVDIFITNTDVKLLYGKVSCVDALTGQLLAIYGEPFSVQKMLRAIITPHPAIFAKREVYESIGRFSLDYRVCMDHEYFLKATRQYFPHFLDDVVSVMRWGGFSAKNIFLAHREAYRIFRSNGGTRLQAGWNLASGYIITFLSLALQRSGLRSVVLSYRRRKGML